MARSIIGFPDYLNKAPQKGTQLTDLEQVLYNALHHAWRYHDQLRHHDVKMMMEALQLAQAELHKEESNEITA